MSHGMAQNNENQETAREVLWRAVITSTVQEWMYGRLSQKREAENFLFQDDKNYKAVCLSAGIDPHDLRERLQRIRLNAGIDLNSRNDKTDIPLLPGRTRP
jgi:hypothetical protein